MTVTIDLTPDEERRLRDRATRLGQDPTSYLQGLIREDLSRGSEVEDAEGALASLREEFAASGMTDDELEILVGEAREERWRERHGRPSRS